VDLQGNVLECTAGAQTATLAPSCRLLPSDWYHKLGATDGEPISYVGALDSPSERGARILASCCT
jgi:hypothetical protein